MKKLLRIFFVVDEGINSSETTLFDINLIIDKIVNQCKMFQSQYYKMEYEVAILCFADSAKWICSPVNVDNYVSAKFEHKNVKSYLSVALEELTKKLHRKEFMMYEGKMVATPHIIFMTGPNPVYDEYEDELNKIRDNAWFSHSLRNMVCVGDKVDETGVLSDIEKLFDNENVVLRLKDSQDSILEDILNALEPRIYGPNQRRLEPEHSQLVHTEINFNEMIELQDNPFDSLCEGIHMEDIFDNSFDFEAQGKTNEIDINMSVQKKSLTRFQNDKSKLQVFVLTRKDNVPVSIDPNGDILGEDGTVLKQISTTQQLSIRHMATGWYVTALKGQPLINGIPANPNMQIKLHTGDILTIEKEQLRVEIV